MEAKRMLHKQTVLKWLLSLFWPLCILEMGPQLEALCCSLKCSAYSLRLALFGDFLLSSRDTMYVKICVPFILLPFFCYFNSQIYLVTWRRKNLIPLWFKQRYKTTKGKGASWYLPANKKGKWAMCLQTPECLCVNTHPSLVPEVARILKVVVMSPGLYHICFFIIVMCPERQLLNLYFETSF